MTITEGIWAKEDDKEFFNNSLRTIPINKLFYCTSDRRYLAYWPKSYGGIRTTLQSRNGPIGNFTEKWSREVIHGIARENGLYAVNNVICEEIGLSSESPADVAICTNVRKIQRAEDIRAIFEVKMSIVWNWECIQNDGIININCIGDYNTHAGTPGLLRSDTMLKAIGKSVGIRISSEKASRVPIIILGNTPIQDSYKTKVDNLKNYGIIQGFWSLNPHPLDDDTRGIKITRGEGFKTLSSITELRDNLIELLNDNNTFFAGWASKEELGTIIETANAEITYESKAEKFFEMI